MSRTFESLVGREFGRLTVIEWAQEKTGAVYYECMCDCGTIKVVRAGNLKSGQVRSCGCLRTEAAMAVDMGGRRFERLVVLRRGKKNDRGTVFWECRCDCGNEVEVAGSHLRAGNTKSCGCLRVDKAKLTNRKHGMQASPAYKRWESIKQRTTNPKNPSYKNYGGRGIVMCPEWFASFETFHAAVGECPSPGFSLDRINNNGNYEPGNVRWASRSQQQLNKRPVIRATKAVVEEQAALIAAQAARITELEASQGG